MIKIVSQNFLFAFHWLCLWLLFNDVDIMLFKTLWHLVRLLILSLNLVLNCSYFVMSHQVGILLLAHAEIVIAQTSLVCDLLRNELWMMSRWDTLIDNFLLLRVRQKVGIHKLRHLNVVGEYIHWDINTLCDRHKLLLLIVFWGFSTSTTITFFILSPSTTFECSNRR